MNTAQDAVRVWDPLVRIGHWLLVAAVLTAYFTEDELLQVHVYAGYVVGAYLIVRLVWGFVGSQHARFADFLYSPFTALRYFTGLVGGTAKRYLGHSPAGAMMVFALLLALAGTTVTGLMLLAEEKGEGPFASFMQQSETTTPAGAEDDSRGSGGEREEEALEEIHELLANLTIILVVLHIAGVALSSRAHHENLVRAMVTGDKPRDTHAA